MTVPDKLTTLILAAGTSSRFGSTKLLANFRQRPLIEQIASAVRFLPNDAVFFATGAAATEVEESIEVYQCIRFDDFAQGQGATIRYATREILRVAPDIDALMILLADQAAIQIDELRKFVAHFSHTQTEGSLQVAVTESGNRKYHQPPVIFTKPWFNKLQQLDGDQGARNLVKEAASQNRLIEFPLPSASLDVDYPHDLLQLERYLSNNP